MGNGGKGEEEDTERDIKQQIVWSTAVDPVASPWSSFTYVLTW